MESVEDPAVYCWGCSKIILVPCIADGKPAEVFKCGWCEAINDLKQQPLLLPQQLGSWAPPQQAEQHRQQHAADYYTQQQLQWQQQQQLQPAIWQPRQELAAAGVSNGHRSTHGSSRRSPWQRCWPVLLAAWRWVVVALVLTLVGSIAGCGIFTLLPLVCSTWATYLPNLSVALMLLFQILFNYAAAVLRPAGRVSDFFGAPPRMADGDVPRGGLQHWSWCQHCQAAKPPRTHHCQSCGTCVVQMDHHCPFLANCVGQGNLRAFLLVLLWVLLAAAYVLCMCALLVWHHWEEVEASGGAGPIRSDSSSMPPPQVWVVNPGGGQASPRSAVADGGVGSSGGTVPSGTASSTNLQAEAGGPELWLFATTGILMLVLQGSPWWLLAAYYLIAVSLGILIAVGMLLGSQLHYLGLGVSYVDHLKAAAQGVQHQPTSWQQEKQQGCWQRREATWQQWWVVVGASSPASDCATAWSMLRAVLVPRWNSPEAAVKKWS